MAKNKIRLEICGCELTLCSDDSETYIRSIGDEVRQAISDTLEQNSRFSVTMAAVITALNYCDASHKAAESADNLRTQIKNYLEDSSHARMDAEESHRELERVQKENQTLRARLAAEGSPAEEAAHDGAEEETSEAETPEQNQTGDFSQAESDSVTSDQASFLNFFEKKTDEQ